MNSGILLERGFGVCRLAAHGDGDRPDVLEHIHGPRAA